MENLFKDYTAEEANNAIRSGGAYVSKPGIYTVVNTDVFIYESTWQDKTYTNAELVLTMDNGAVITDDIRTIPKSNQKLSDLVNYLHRIATVCDVLPQFAEAVKKFSKLPTAPYKTKYGKDVKAQKIAFFNNAKYKAMMYTEVSGSANGIFYSQRVTLNQLFRFLDNSSLGEIKDEKEAGASYTYWSDDDFAKCKEKVFVQWVKDRDEAEQATLEEIAEFLKIGGKLTKQLKEKIQESFGDAGYVKQLLANKPSATAADQVDEPEVEDSEDAANPFG